MYRLTAITMNRDQRYRARRTLPFGADATVPRPLLDRDLRARAPYGGYACNLDEAQAGGGFPPSRPIGGSEFVPRVRPMRSSGWVWPYTDRWYFCPPAPSRNHPPDRVARSKAAGR